MLLRHQVRRVLVELGDVLKVLWHTPRAIGPISTFTIDQLGQGIILTLVLVVFRDEFREGVGSVSNVIGASGIGVIAGIATVGPLVRRFRKEWVVGLAFGVAGGVLIAAGLNLRDWSLFGASFIVGLTFAWKKIPTDTLVQESLPDGYRGRVFSLFDVAYNAARIVSGALALALVPALGTRGTVMLVGGVFLACVPLLPRWIRGVPEIELVTAPDGVGPPSAVRWGGVEEPVEVQRAWVEDGAEGRTDRLRLRLADGSVIDLQAGRGPGVEPGSRARGLTVVRDLRPATQPALSAGSPAGTVRTRRRAIASTTAAAITAIEPEMMNPARAPRCSPIQPTIGEPIGVEPRKITP